MTKMIPTDNAAFLNAFGMIVGGDTGLNASARRVEIVRIAQSTSGSDVDYVAEEVPIALVYNGISHAVMMQRPPSSKSLASASLWPKGLLPIFLKSTGLK